MVPLIARDPPAGACVVSDPSASYAQAYQRLPTFRGSLASIAESMSRRALLARVDGDELVLMLAGVVDGDEPVLVMVTSRCW